MESKYNSRNPAVKRLMREAYELRNPTEEYYASPLENNLFEWHFTIHGSPSSEFEGGIYHGRILLPNEYPMKPPNIILLTPNGRFETNKKICLSISGHHPETWRPSWSIRTALLALIAFMLSPGNGAIGSLDYSSEERKILAKRSKNWVCNECGKIANLIIPNSQPVAKEESETINRISIKTEDVPKKDSEDHEKKEIVDSVKGEEEVKEEPEKTKKQANEDVKSTRNDQTERLQNSSENNNTRGFMWALIAAIFLLVARRLFLL